MSSSCPLNFIKVDSNVARFSSLFVALSVLFYLYSENVWVLYFLFFDFTIKLFVDPKFSPIFLLANYMKNVLDIQDKFTDGGAKRLAAFFGLFFLLMLIIVDYFALRSISFGIAFIFLMCSLLDVFFNFCIGCKIYYIIKKIYPGFMNNL